MSSMFAALRDLLISKISDGIPSFKFLFLAAAKLWQFEMNLRTVKVR